MKQLKVLSPYGRPVHIASESATFFVVGGKMDKYRAELEAWRINDGENYPVAGILLVEFYDPVDLNKYESVEDVTEMHWFNSVWRRCEDREECPVTSDPIFIL